MARLNATSDLQLCLAYVESLAQNEGPKSETSAKEAAVIRQGWELPPKGESEEEEDEPEGSVDPRWNPPFEFCWDPGVPGRPPGAGMAAGPVITGAPGAPGTPINSHISY